MEKFTPEQFTDFLDRIEKLKSVPRHCVTADGVQENVAGHSWRVSLMAYLLKDELGEIDIDKVIRMCLIHDLGEAVTGDIPTFEKTSEHEAAEKEALDGLLRSLPAPLYEELKVLYAEMDALETKEARVYKALDKLEAVIQHNESDISTWLPLEYDLQQTYAAEIVKGYPFLEGLQDVAVWRTCEKIAAQRSEDSASAAQSASGAAETVYEPLDHTKTSDDISDDTAADKTHHSLKEQLAEKKSQAAAARTQRAEEKAAEKAQRAEEKAAAKVQKAEQKAEQKTQARHQKAEAKQEKKNQRSLVWQERRRELNLLTHIFSFVMLIAFIILAIDQVGVYGFLGVWLFIALMAASVAVLLAGIWRTVKQKRGGILIGAAVVGILLCAGWFIYLFFAQGAGLGPVPG